ncbi:retrotransposon protein, putative, ty3-gypsy subclass [Tanacetum coccineum]
MVKCAKEKEALLVNPVETLDTIRQHAKDKVESGNNAVASLSAAGGQPGRASVSVGSQSSSHIDAIKQESFSSSYLSLFPVTVDYCVTDIRFLSRREFLSFQDSSPRTANVPFLCLLPAETHSSRMAVAPVECLRIGSPYGRVLRRDGLLMMLLRRDWLLYKFEFFPLARARALEEGEYLPSAQGRVKIVLSTCSVPQPRLVFLDRLAGHAVEQRVKNFVRGLHKHKSGSPLSPLCQQGSHKSLTVRCMTDEMTLQGSEVQSGGILVLDATKGTEASNPTDLPTRQSRVPSEGYTHPVCNTCGRRHPGECRRAAGTCFKCGQAGHLQRDCKKNIGASSSGHADKKPDASGRVFALTQDQAANTSGEKFVWNEEQEKSFEELKQRLVFSPILTLPSGSGGFQIYSDALSTGSWGLKYETRVVGGLLRDYDTNIRYHPGKANVVADALSRKSGMIIKTAQKDDGEIWAIIQNIDQQTEFRVDDDGILWQGTKLCVPEDPTLREALMTEAHSSPFSIHPGSTKMLRLNLNVQVGYCKVEITCLKWDEISPMDVCYRVTRTQRKHDAIPGVVVDRLTKSDIFFFPIVSDRDPVSRLVLERFTESLVNRSPSPGKALEAPDTSEELRRPGIA